MQAVMRMVLCCAPQRNPDGVAQERGDHPSGRGGKQPQRIYTLHSWAGEEPWIITLFVMLCYVHQPETQQVEVMLSVWLIVAWTVGQQLWLC
jgi:hypothetical protein